MEVRRREVERSWLITIQAPKDSGEGWYAKIPDKWEGSYQYRCAAYERGVDACSMHYHLLIYFKSRRVSNMIAKDLIKCNTGCEIDVEVKRGTWQEAIQYVKKQDHTAIRNRVIEEWGTIPKEDKRTSNRNIKEEHINLVEAIKERGLKGALELDPSYIIKNPNGCKLIKELTEEKSKKRTVGVTIIWGDAGTGKSTWAAQEGRKKYGDDVYYYTKVGGSKDTIWFNGYDGEKCLIMDDVWGRTMPYEYMLKITGNDPLDVEVKGSRVAAKWETIYITSNYDPRCWYNKIWEENWEAREAFFRRIARIIHVFKNEENETIWRVEKEEEIREMKDDFVIEPQWEKTPNWVRLERESIAETTPDIVKINGVIPCKKAPLEPILKETELNEREEFTREEECGEADEEFEEELPLLGEDSIENGGNKE